MDNKRLLRILVMITVLTIGLIFFFGLTTQAQLTSGFTFPTSYFYTSPLSYPSYGYFNSINGYLLGYGVFSPFLTPTSSLSYNTLGIPTYPYFGSPYQTTFPYTTLPGTPIPYARFDYPTYTYGDPSFYSAWNLLQ